MYVFPLMTDGQEQDQKKETDRVKSLKLKYASVFNMIEEATNKGEFELCRVVLVDELRDLLRSMGYVVVPTRWHNGYAWEDEYDIYW